MIRALGNKPSRTVESPQSGVLSGGDRGIDLLMVARVGAPFQALQATRLHKLELLRLLLRALSLTGLCVLLPPPTGG